MTALAIGIGCRKGCAAAAIVEVVRRALATLPSPASREKVPLAERGADEGVEAALPSPALTSFGHPLPLRGRGKAALFTSTAKRHEPGIARAAAALGLPLIILDDAALADAAPRCVTRSARVEAITGLPSLAEAAALAGAGEGSRLVVARISGGGATCAIAAPKDTP